MLKKSRCPAGLLLILAAAAAVAGAPSGNKAAGSPVVENLAIVLLIDTSGSMSYTDPERLRETAANLFIDLLSPDDYLSVITFDQEAKVRVPLEAVGGAPRRAFIKSELAAGLHPRGYTDYRAALQAAGEQLEAVSAENLRPVVILLTDGEPYPGGRDQGDPAFMDRYMESMWETVNGFTAAKRPVYSIAFSDEVDPAVIERVSILTKGDHYLLSTPRELLATFYALLEGLKNRHRIIDENFFLPGTARGFPLTVDREADQVNLIIENPAGGDFNVALTPPPGVDGSGGNPAVSRGPGYAMIVFHQPGEVLQGRWEITVSGEGPFRVLGNADNPLKAWIVEPAPGAMVPLGEVIPLAVCLTGVEPGAGPRPELFLQVAGPDQSRPEPVELCGSNGTYTGTYTAAVRPGTYEILVTVLCGGKIAARASAKIYVKNLPLPEANFTLRQSYRRGETVEPSASLLLGGHRLGSGSELEVDRYQFILSYGGGTRVTVPLVEGGGPEQDALPLPGGFWSGRLTLDREGEGEAALLAIGRYRGEEFVLEKNLGRFAVRSPGTIALECGRDRFYTVPGRTLVIPVTMENRSFFAETLKISRPGGGSFGPLEAEFSFQPGEVKKVNLSVQVSPEASPGPETLRFMLQAGHLLTATEPDRGEMAVEICSLPVYLYRRLTSPGPLSSAGAILALGGTLFFGGGLLLYRLLVYPHNQLGRLVYWQGEPAGPPPGAQTLILSRAGRRKAVVSFGPCSGGDFLLPGSGSSHDLVFEVKNSGRPAPFLRGWLALRRRQPAVEKVVRATPPGVLETGGAIYTRQKLYHGITFQSGEFFFQYLEPRARTPAQNSGINLLEGKM